MRKFYPFIIALMCVLFASCSKQAVSVETINEYVTVNLSMSGELDVTYAPLTKSANYGLYGVQVLVEQQEPYSFNSIGLAANAYAYGLFSDPSLISFKLRQGVSYRFMVDYIADVTYNDFSERNGFIPLAYQPYGTYWHTIPILNEPVYSTTDYMPFLGGDITDHLSGREAQCGEYDRYIGITETITVDGPDVSIPIDMKRMTSGLTITLTDIENLPSGEVPIFSFDMRPSKTYTFEKRNDTYYLEIPKFATPNGDLSYDDDFVPKAFINIGIPSDKKLYYGKEVIFYRNTMANFTMAIPKADESTGHMSVSMSSDPMATANYTL